MRWWGNVRIASIPQQISTPVATFAADFVNQVGNIPVNKLAQSAEFTGELELRLFASDEAFRGQSEDATQRFILSLFAGGGTTGSPDPQDTLRVFEVPVETSAQRERFVQTFPEAGEREFVGFIAPDRDRFFRQYMADFRLTTMYADPAGGSYTSPAAMVSFSIGQNELVTAGRLRGLIARVEAFYPLPIGGGRSRLASMIYLFGSAQLKLGTANSDSVRDPFILKPAIQKDTDGNEITATGADGNEIGVPVQGFNTNVVLVTTRSNRDTYKIGVGIDFVQLVQAFGNNGEPTRDSAENEQANTRNWMRRPTLVAASTRP